MAARSIWNGSLAIGELAIPVKLFSAVQQHRVRFREVRISDGSRINHPRFGSESGEEVPPERIRRAYETIPGHQVILSDEEIASVTEARGKTIEIEEFVKVAEIDPVFYDRPYILGAQAGSQRAYRVLHDALERTGKAGIGRFVLRSREQLLTLAPRDGALRIYTMRYADELVRSAELEIPELGAAPSSKEMSMAKQLIATLEQEWDPAAYEDNYRDAVMSLIERKAGGAKVEVEPAAEPRETPDLLAALQASIDRGGKGTARRAAPRKREGAKSSPRETKTSKS